MGFKMTCHFSRLKDFADVVVRIFVCFLSLGGDVDPILLRYRARDLRGDYMVHM